MTYGAPYAARMKPMKTMRSTISAYFDVRLIPRSSAFMSPLGVQKFTRLQRWLPWESISLNLQKRLENRLQGSYHNVSNSAREWKRASMSVVSSVSTVAPYCVPTGTQTEIAQLCDKQRIRAKSTSIIQTPQETYIHAITGTSRQRRVRRGG